MELRQLTTFQMTAKTLSFSRTAANLNYAQSTVSAQMQELEKELGVVLFDRMGKQITLTEAGQRLLLYADKMLDLADQARSVLDESALISGSLVVGVPETLCAYRLPPILRRYHERFPQVHLYFRSDTDDNDLQRNLREGVIDFAFVFAEPFLSTSLVVEHLFAEPLVLVTHPDHPLAKKPMITFDDLAEETLILTDPSCGYRRVFERSRSATGVCLSTPIEFHSVEAIKQCAMSGIGIGFLPQVTVESEIAQGRLVPLSFTREDLHITTQLVWHKDKWISPAMKAFIDMVHEGFAALSPETLAIAV